MVEFDILIEVFVLIIHLHLVWIIACHWCIHIHIIHLLIHLNMVSILLIDLPALELALYSRLTERGDEDTAASSAFLIYKKDGN